MHKPRPDDTSGGPTKIEQQVKVALECIDSENQNASCDDHIEHVDQGMAFATNGMTPPSVETRSGAFPQCAEASDVVDGGSNGNSDGGVDMEKTSDHVGPVGMSEVDVDVDLDVNLEDPLETTGTEWADYAETVDSALSSGALVLPGVSWSSVVAKEATHVARANCANASVHKNPPASSKDFVILHKQGSHLGQD